MNVGRFWQYLRRAAAFFLILVVWVAMFSFVSADPIAAPADIYVTLYDQAISEVNLKKNDRVPLKLFGASGEEGLAWQIADPNASERWINIANAQAETLWLSFALVGSMLDENGEARLRCCLTKDGAARYTAPVCVSVVEEVDVQQTTYYAPTTVAETAEDEEEVPELRTYSVVINYLFDDNTIAFEPYGATVGAGWDFNPPPVKSPEVLGYAPFRRVGEDYVDASYVTIDLKNVQEDVVINVIYEPKLMPFKVHHHFQNLNDDEYSLHADRVTDGMGLTGSTVGDGLVLTPEELPGFTALDYEKLTVAADGSTVIEIRYDRNYYLVDFQPNGGYGAEPIYTRFGAPVGANTPTRHGYVFDGWELVSYNDTAPTAEQISMYNVNNGPINVPAANLSYRARWITAQTEYTMVFWKENADDNGYSYWGYLKGLPAMSGDLVDGRDYIDRVSGIDDEAYFTFNSVRTDKDVLVEGDGSTVVNVYYSRNYYTLTFKAEANCAIPEGHIHGDACYDTICGYIEHVHDENCPSTLTCPLDEHTEHTDACIVCGKTAHIHGSGDCPCTIEIHTHAKSCWKNVGNPASVEGVQPTGDGYIHTTGWIFNRKSYIYIKGVWYSYSGSGYAGDTVLPSCGNTEHVHGVDCSCKVPEHIHDTSCYNDALHFHNENCYEFFCGGGTHYHSDACYRRICGITERHTHNSDCTRSNRENVIKTVYRKYKQSLADIWPIKDDNNVSYAGGQRWKPNGSPYYTEVMVYLSEMPPDDFSFILNESSASTYTLNYYHQVLPGKPYTHTFKNNRYVLHHSVAANYNHVTEKEDFFDVSGFYQFGSDPAFSGGKAEPNDKIVDMYYNRITDHVLEFKSQDSVLDDKTQANIMYGAPLEEYNFTPPYPDTLEQYAYTFGGWYTSPGCFDGTEVNWKTLTMPEGDLMLYAKWEPVKHAVRVFKDVHRNEQIGDVQLVDHNGFALAPSEAISNSGYVFKGWFYQEEVNGKLEEKAFAFNGIPVLHDMDIYAKWSSHVPVDYVIHYRLKGSGKPIADSTRGTTIAGNNMTFDAKAGDQLYEGYQTGYYPLANSHTITMSVDGNREFVFEYVFVESMPYIVRYVDAATGDPLLPEKKVTTNSLSVVTETFERIEKWMPDSYQKRLVLSASGTDGDGDGVLDKNILTFYYDSDPEHAYYRVVHYLQNIAGDTYREYYSEETVGVIGQSYTIQAADLTGFALAEKAIINKQPVTVVDKSVTAELGEEGMLIELYYDRLPATYTVRYVNTSGTPLREDKQGNGVFGEQIAEKAASLDHLGYKLSGPTPETVRTLILSMNTEHNVITFVYEEKTVSIKYRLVGPLGCGSLTSTSENVTASLGVPNGSGPLVNNGFLFMGWFTDEACLTAVDPAAVDEDGYFIPVKDGAVWHDTTYYAKFIAKETDLTISANGCVDADQSFMFRVVGKQGTETAGIDVTISVLGNGSTTIAKLPTGEYTVSALSAWAWRYEPIDPVRDVTLTYNEAGNQLSFNHVRRHEQWLDGNHVNTNLFNN